MEISKLDDFTLKFQTLFASSSPLPAMFLQDILINPKQNFNDSFISACIESDLNLYGVISYMLTAKKKEDKLEFIKTNKMFTLRSFFKELITENKNDKNFNIKKELNITDQDLEVLGLMHRHMINRSANYSDWGNLGLVVADVGEKTASQMILANDVFLDEIEDEELKKSSIKKLYEDVLFINSNILFQTKLANRWKSYGYDLSEIIELVPALKEDESVIKEVEPITYKRIEINVSALLLSLKNGKVGLKSATEIFAKVNNIIDFYNEELKVENSNDEIDENKFRIKSELNKKNTTLTLLTHESQDTSKLIEFLEFTIKSDYFLNKNSGLPYLIEIYDKFNLSYKLNSQLKNKDINKKLKKI